MSQQIRYQLIIVAAAAVIFFVNLGSTGLWDMDEALYSACAREMLERDNWVVPWFNGDMFPEKPPLMFWTMIAGFKLFGVNEFGARFFSAVLGAATALLAFHLGRLLFNPRVGFWTGLITASTIIFTISARAATADCVLTFVTTAAMLFFVLGRIRHAKPQAANRLDDVEYGDNIPSHRPLAANPPSPVIRPSSPLRLPYAALMYGCLGLAVLAKGPVGMVLPLAALGLFVLIEGGWRRAIRSAWEMRPLTAVVVIAAVALPWYVMVGLQTDGQWLRQFFLEFNLRPFKQPILGHGDASSLQHVWAATVSFLYYFYHIPAVLFGFFPWSVFLGPTLIHTVQSLRKKTPLPSPLSPLLPVCWFGVWLIFWSICKTKLPHYLLPAYPALAVLTAFWIDRWLSGESGESRWSAFSRHWLRDAWISTIVAGLGIVVAIPIVAGYYLPGDAPIGLVGLIPLVGGVWCWRETARGRDRRALGVFSVMAVLFLTATFGFAALRVDRHQNAEPMMDAIRADYVGQVGNLSNTSNSGQVDNLSYVPPIATYRFFRESTVYYAGHPVTRCEGDRQTALATLGEFLDQPGPVYIIATDRQEGEIMEAFGGRLQVIFRHPRFLSPGEMVVFRCDGSEASGSTKP